MTELTTEIPPNSPKYPNFIRRVTFMDDQPDTGIDPPVHVSLRCLIDGVYTPGLVNLKLGWSVIGGGFDGTLLRMFVAADQVTMPTRAYHDDNPPKPAFTIAGRPCLTPVGTKPGSDPSTGNLWSTVHCVDPTPAGSYPVTANGEGEHDWVEVVLFVREVEVIGRRDVNE